jgi:autotransporter adhesin
LGNFNATAIGSNASAGTTAAGQDNATALGADSSANALNATALGAGATANFANSTAIGQGVATTRANQIALGTTTNTYTMTGIGSADSLAAQDPTSIRIVTSDAGGNLALSAFDPSSLATSASVTALDSRMTSLEGTVGENREEARGGTALALAAASLRYDDRPEKLSIAGGVGYFKGLTGLSFGVGYATSDTFRINGAVSGVPELGDVGVSAGVSWTLN